ncbi:MAG: transposase [Caldilineaceae bacterium]
MAKPQFRAGHCYHVYNRGVNRGPIFFTEENWGFFIRRIREYFKPEFVTILAYCLMPNHYHLLLRLKIDEFSSKIMQPFSTSYTKAINKQQNRVGPLFQGKFKAELVDRDEYLTYLSKYIHLNPVKAGLVQSPAVWAYSSYRDYIGMRSGTLPSPQLILERFPNQQAYQQFVEIEPTTGSDVFARWLRSYLEKEWM